MDKSSDSILSKATLPLSVYSGATDIIQNNTDDDDMDEEGSDEGGWIMEDDCSCCGLMTDSEEENDEEENEAQFIVQSLLCDILAEIEYKL